MKKAIAIFLAVFLAFSLFGCASNEKPAAEGPSSGGDAPSSAGVSGGESSAFPKEAGYFDPDFDYAAHESYKVGYLVVGASPLWDAWNNAYKDWAKRLNINFTDMWTPVNSNADEYLSGLQTFVDQGYDGLILDPDVTLYPRIIEILDEANMPWACGIGQARNYSGDNRLYHPHIGFNNFQVGVDMLNWLVNWKETTYPDVPWEKVGVLWLDFSLSPEIHQRCDGAETRWAELRPEFGSYDPAVDTNPKNFFIADVATGDMNQTTAQNLTTQVLSKPGDIEVWLIGTAVDDYSVGAANAADNLHIVDKVCTVCHGGVSLAPRWDSGIDDAWRAACFTSQNIYAEPIICQLWAYMAGQATPDTIFQEWVNVNDKGDAKDENGNVTEEHSYATVLIPAYFLERDTYKNYLEWTDLYAYGEGAEGVYKYDPVTDLSLFSARFDKAPDHYKAQN